MDLGQHCHKDRADKLMCDKIRTVSVETMRKSDAWTIANKVSSKELMRRAGEGIFKEGCWKAPVAIVCGKGNNAGDGYVVALLLESAGIDCTIVRLSDEFSDDGRYYYDMCLKKRIRDVLLDDITDEEFLEFKTILDCILGTGFSGELKGKIKKAVDMINKSDAFVISADINSGLNGDTGMGVDYVKSDLTVSIGDFKTGHFRGLSDKAMKRKVNVDIGIIIQGPIEYISINKMIN